jgi:hypothetical protein
VGVVVAPGVVAPVAAIVGVVANATRGVAVGVGAPPGKAEQPSVSAAMKIAAKIVFILSSLFS